MIHFSDEVKKVLNESYEQQLNRPIKAVELPCTKYHKYLEPQIVEITRTGDQKITCPRCGRQHYLTWSKIGNNRWG